jgi:tetratricopeptide (TPR) repeat protein
MEHVPNGVTLLKRFAALITLLLIAGCSATKSPPAPSNAAPVKASDAAPVQPAPAAAVNDEAFALIKQQRWPEAIAAAQKAIAANGDDSAAHFNLGRAYLGAGQAAEAAAAFVRASQLTGAANADVEYFRGQALVANQQVKEAAQVWTGALAGPLHGDKEIAAELQKVLGKLDLAVAVGDVNADGKPDLLQVKAERLTITSGTGERLYDGDLPPKSLKEITHRIRLYPLSTGAPLIHVEIPACASAPLNALFWYGVPVG